MPRAARPWLRLYTETFSDRKILRLTPPQRWLWTAMLGAARESPTPGDLLVAEGVPMTHAELARYADVSVRMVPAALEMMASLGMVVIDGDVIRLPNFTARQFESDDVTARTRAHRERSKEQGRNVPTNVRRNTPETETETETEQKGSGPRKRGTRLPDEWVPDQRVRIEMAEQFPHVNLRLAHDKFVDYWRSQPGAKGVKLDWNGTWRNWIRREAERTPTRTNGHGRQQDTDDFFDRALARAQQADAQDERLALG